MFRPLAWTKLWPWASRLLLQSRLSPSLIVSCFEESEARTVNPVSRLRRPCTCPYCGFCLKYRNNALSNLCSCCGRFL